MGEYKLLLEHYEKKNIASLEVYRKHGGYESLDALFAKEPAQWIDEVKGSGLCGRGGAGFPTGVKWSFLAQGTGKPTYLVVNADESEPGTCHDRRLIERLPHQLIEGIINSCYAIGAHLAFVYIRGEYLEPYEILVNAVNEARAAGLLGDKVAGRDFALDIIVHRGAGAYICGEETALLSSLEGDKGQPRQKPPFPAVAGLYAAPTIVNNVQTICTIPHIVKHGGEWFKGLNLAEGSNSPGPRILSVSGHVKRPGIYEVMNGTPFQEVIYDLCGGIRNDHDLKSVIPGGSSAPVLPADVIMECTLDYDSIAKAGSMLGSGAVIVMDETTCMVKALERLSYFYFEESCGQCTPCREGTGWLYRVVHRIEHGEGRPEDLDLLNSVTDNIMGRTICALGDAASMPVKSFIKHFGAEFEYHIQNKKCLVPEDVQRAGSGFFKAA